MGSGPGGADEVRAHAWFSPNWATTECLPARVNEPGDEAFFDWTWKTLRSISPGPFHPTLTSETDTSYFREEEAMVEDSQLQNEGEEEALEAGQNGGDVASSSPPRAGEGADTFEGSQLSFAGFTFSSPKLAPLAGIYLAPPQSPSHEVVSSSYEAPPPRTTEEIDQTQRETHALLERIRELGADT